MATLTITLEAVIDGKRETVTRIASIPDEFFPDYVAGHHVKHAMANGVLEMEVVKEHLSSVIVETERAVNAAIYRRKFNQEMLKHAPIKL